MCFFLPLQQKRALYGIFVTDRKQLISHRLIFWENGGAQQQQDDKGKKWKIKIRIKDSRRGLCADSQDKSWSTSLTVPVFLLHFSSLFLLLFFFAGVSYILSVIFVSLLLSAFYVPLPSTTTMATLYMRRHKRENAGQQNHRRTRPAMFNGCRRFPLRDDPPSATTDHSYFFPSSNVVSNCPGKQQHSTVMKNTLLFSKNSYSIFFLPRV